MFQTTNQLLIKHFQEICPTLYPLPGGPIRVTLSSHRPLQIFRNLFKCQKGNTWIFFNGWIMAIGDWYLKIN